MNFDFHQELRDSLAPKWKRLAWRHIVAHFGNSAGTMRVSNRDEDKAGADFVMNCDGIPVFVDIKTRADGCSSYWKCGPELALEDWSVIPDDNNFGQVGWTRDEQKVTTFVLHLFSPVDSELSYLFPFQRLVAAYKEHRAEWLERFQVADQRSRRHTSRCVFVPASVVFPLVAGAQERIVRDDAQVRQGSRSSGGGRTLAGNPEFDW